MILPCYLNSIQASTIDLIEDRYYKKYNFEQIKSFTDNVESYRNIFRT